MIPLAISKLTTPDGMEVLYLSGQKFLCFRREPAETEWRQWPPDTFHVENFPKGTEVESRIL